MTAIKGRTTYTVKNLQERVEDGCLSLDVSSDRPMHLDVYDNSVTLSDGEGNVYLAEVIDFHDAYAFGGPESFVWLELK
jgi:hypothetical protein